MTPRSIRFRLSLPCLLFVGFFLGNAVHITAAQIRVDTVRVSEGVAQQLVVNKVSPEYPPLARQARIQGKVILRARIDESGNVTDLKLVSGHPMLAPAAIEAVKQWKYRPYVLNGSVVKIQTDIEVDFALSPPAAKGVAGDAPGDLPPAFPTGGTEGAMGSAPENQHDEVPAVVPHIATPLRIRVSQGVMSGLCLSKVGPEYPEDARQQRIEGQVILKVLIDKEGHVKNVTLISGHPLLAPAAVAAVQQWKYKPYLLNQQPIAVETQVTVNFTLAN